MPKPIAYWVWVNALALERSGWVEAGRLASGCRAMVGPGQLDQLGSDTGGYFKRNDEVADAVVEQLIAISEMFRLVSGQVGKGSPLHAAAIIL